jgi:hypothetical protein
MTIPCLHRGHEDKVLTRGKTEEVSFLQKNEEVTLVYFNNLNLNYEFEHINELIHRVYLKQNAPLQPSFMAKSSIAIATVM